MFCKGCEAAWYCGKQCQEAHWPTHKTTCKKATVAAAASEAAPDRVRQLQSLFEEAEKLHKQTGEMLPEVWRKYFEAAENGHQKACYVLGEWYLMSETKFGNEKELYRQAVKWLKKAGNHPQALYTLGFCYEVGLGVEQNDVTAATYYEQVAKMNYAEAQYTIALCYEHGDGVVRNLDTAVRWYKKAAAQKHRESQEALARVEKQCAEEAAHEVERRKAEEQVKRRAAEIARIKEEIKRQANQIRDSISSCSVQTRYTGKKEWAQLIADLKQQLEVLKKNSEGDDSLEFKNKTQELLTAFELLNDLIKENWDRSLNEEQKEERRKKVDEQRELIGQLFSQLNLMR